MDEGKLYLSYAAIGRVAYQKTLNNLVGERCTDRRNLCEACLLFGMISGNAKEEAGLGSRIRISNAYLCNDKKPVQKTLKVLGTPRNSYLPFYAHDEDGKVWNGKRFLTYDDTGVKIAGRKYYWHNKKVEENNAGYERKEQDALNATIQVLEQGAEFSFDVHYDGITDEQWQKLLWVLTLGENSVESRMCHKIGHGKPLGLGSVKLVVEDCFEREVNVQGYQVISKEIKEIKNPFADSEIAKALAKVLNMEEPFAAKVNKRYLIDYPDLVDKKDRPIDMSKIGEKDKNKYARHQWYSQNKKKTEEVQVLPDVLDEEQVLKAYKIPD